MSRLLVPLVVLFLLVLLASSHVEAHVRLLYAGSQPSGMPIRNAASAKVDGAYSVSGPCGGVSKYGAQGVTTITSGTTMTLKIAYNGGHQAADNAFHIAYKCGTYTVGSTFDDSQLKPSSTPITSSTPGVITLNDNTVTVPAADSSTAGYVLTFTAPTLPQGVNSQDCVFSAMDQRNWGGCVDVKLLRPGTSGGGSGGTTPTTPKSPCSTFCDGMAAECVGSNQQYPYKGLDCMTNCANFTYATPGANSYDGDNLQCRQQHLGYAVQNNQRALHCPHAGVISTTCVDPPAAGVRKPSPCKTYCDAVFANCASSNYYSTYNQCLSTCATFLMDGLGASANLGNNTQCRIAAASSSATCADASPIATGTCLRVNPYKVESSDTISAYYKTQAGQCDTALQRAQNTVSGCCCLAGTAQLIHMKGATTALVRLDLTATGGEMCGSGSMTITNAIDTTKKSNYTFASAIVAPSGYASSTQFTLTQSDSTDTTLTGSFTVGDDPMEFELVDGGLLLITNNAPSSRTPRICSTQAKYATKIDSNNPPPAGSGGDGNTDISAASFVSSTSSLLVAALVALFSLLQL